MMNVFLETPENEHFPSLHVSYFQRICSFVPFHLKNKSKRTTTNLNYEILEILDIYSIYLDGLLLIRLEPFISLCAPSFNDSTQV